MTARKSGAKTKAARPCTVAGYLASLTPEKRTVIEEARAFVLKHIPKGYAEFMNCSPSKPCGNVNALATAHLAAVEDKLARLKLLRDELSRLIAECNPG